MLGKRVSITKAERINHLLTVSGCPAMKRYLVSCTEVLVSSTFAKMSVLAVHGLQSSTKIKICLRLRLTPLKY
jgi:hypothetical protein